MLDFTPKKVKPKTKILCVYAKAGGGHLNMAKSLQSQFELINLQSEHEIEFKIVDAFAGSPLVFQNILTKVYPWITDKMQWLWRILFVLAEIPVSGKIINFVFKLASEKYLNQQVQEFQPNIILNTYYLSDVLRQVSNNAKDFKPKVLTVVCDWFTPHPAFFLDSKGEYIVFSEQALNLGRKFTQKATFKQFGLVVHPKFRKKTSKKNLFKLNQELNLKPVTKKILFLGGGSNFPRAEKTIQNFIQKLNKLNLSSEVDLLVVCGKNQNLQNKLLKLKQVINVNLQILGFVENLPDLISLSDLVVSKAGPATLAEVLKLQKPILILSYIWKQERGNLDWIINNNYGLYEDKIEKTIQHLINFIKNTEQFYFDFPNLQDEELEKLCKWILEKKN